MIFYEKLTVVRLLSLYLSQKEALYHRKSFVAQLLENTVKSISPTQRSSTKIKPLEWGSTHFMTDIIKNASLRSEDYAESLLTGKSKMLKDAAYLFNINFTIIFNKYVIANILYRKYIFYELALQYLRENNEPSNTFYVEKLFMGEYQKKLQEKGKTVYLSTYTLLEFLAALISVPILLPLYWKNKISDKQPIYENSLLFLTTDRKEYECYKDIFGSMPQVQYLTNAIYAKYFSDEQFAANEIQILGLNKRSYNALKVARRQYLALMLKHSFFLHRFGIHMLLLYNKLITGRSYAPCGKGNVCFSYEHHDLIKSIRNEFIRAEGSETVFISYLPPTVLRYYPEEYYENYDYLCSSGPYFEDQFKENRSSTKHIIKTGSYTVNKALSRKGTDVVERIEKLKKFKGNSIAVTILCPGVCKPTYISEAKLMKLTQKLVGVENVKIFIRKKPFELDEQYCNFYESYFVECNNVWVTGSEFELYDFVPVTDLFITSYSTSACEVALVGADIFFVDLLRQSDRFIFWEKDKIGSLLLSEEEAFDKIAAWLGDKNNGPVRTAHKKAMNHFNDYLGYRFPDFESYKANLLAQLRENVFRDNPAFKGI